MTLEVCENYMKMALDIAAKGTGRTAPNPKVGAVLVSNEGQILSTGYHEEAGKPHAEVNCLQKIQEIPQNAVLYINLEPCSHHGKTKPCTQYLLEKNIKQVVVGMVDPNPKVNGNGIEILRSKGVNVTVGLLEKECRFLNRIFIKNIVENRIFVALKTAMTLDGRIATINGDSKWITTEPSRKIGHELRSEYGAVAVGGRTFEIDEPSLDNRYSPHMPQPVGIVFWGERTIPKYHKFYNNQLSRRIFIVSEEIPTSEIRFLASKGIEIIKANITPDNLKNVLEKLFEMNVRSLMLEGGAGINSKFLESMLVDCFHFFISPKILGCRNSIGWSEKYGVSLIQDSLKLKFIDVRQSDCDMLLTAVPQYE